MPDMNLTRYGVAKAKVCKALSLQNVCGQVCYTGYFQPAGELPKQDMALGLQFER